METIAVVKQEVPKDLQEHYFGIEWLSTDKSLARVITGVYNKGLRASNKLEE